MNINYKNYILCFVILLINSCASNIISKLPWEKENKDNNSFYSTGRIKVKVKDKGFYGNFELIKTDDITIITFNHPLGSAIGRLCIKPNQVIINDYKNNMQYSNSIDEFTKKIIGYFIPLNEITSWIIGQYSDNYNFQVLNDNELIQDGWKIKRFTDKNKNPKNIEILKDNLYIKIFFDKFNKINEKKHIFSSC